MQAGQGLDACIIAARPAARCVTGLLHRCIASPSNAQPAPGLRHARHKVAQPHPLPLVRGFDGRRMRSIGEGRGRKGAQARFATAAAARFGGPSRAMKDTELESYHGLTKSVV